MTDICKRLVSIVLAIVLILSTSVCVMAAPKSKERMTNGSQEEESTGKPGEKNIEANPEERRGPDDNNNNYQPEQNIPTFNNDEFVSPEEEFEKLEKRYGPIKEIIDLLPNSPKLKEPIELFTVYEEYENHDYSFNDAYYISIDYFTSVGFSNNNLRLFYGYPYKAYYKETYDYDCFTYDIPNEHFKNRELIEKVYIGDCITSIGSKAFDGCTKITEIYFDCACPEIAEDAFNGVTAKVYLSKDWDESQKLNYGGNLTYIVSSQKGNEETTDDIYITLRQGEGETISVLVTPRTFHPESVPMPTVEKAGYCFDGWYDSDGNKLTLDSVITKSSTYDAKWVAEEDVLPELTKYLLYLGFSQSRIDQITSLLSSNSVAGTILASEPIWGVVLIALVFAGFAGGLAVGKKKK